MNMNKSKRNINDIIKSIRTLSKSREFHRETKISDLSKFITTPYYTWPKSWRKIYYKAYPRFKQTILPKPSNRHFNLYNALIKKESYREYSKDPVSFQQFSDLLYYSAGMQKIALTDKSTKRMYPSAGARYPLEIYPFIFRVKNVEDAVYHYHLKTHSLELILKKPVFNQTMRQFNQTWIRNSAVLLVITAVFDRTEKKYKDRGYRHVLAEYGHMAQNMYLVSTALGLGCCSIGGFNDDGLNKLLDVDGIDESVVGVVACGNRSK